MKFEDDALKRILENLIKKRVLVKEKDKYIPTKHFDLFFRGQVIREIEDKTNPPEIITVALVKILDYYNVFIDEGNTLTNQNIVRTMRTFVPQDKETLLNQLPSSSRIKEDFK